MALGSGEPAPINFLYTNIGRGHPFYLDGVIECLPPDRVGAVTDVFAVTSGLARGAWNLARFVYDSAARTRPSSVLYNRTRQRSDFNRRGLMRSIMGRPLQRMYLSDPSPLVVAHPALVAMLCEKPNLVYRHGEVAAPRESWVRGRQRVIFPLTQTADTLIAAGLSAERIFISGLCIEPALVARAEDALRARLERLAGSGPLCGAFFSSGAEPRAHVEALSAAAVSAVTAGGRVVAFARRSGRLAARLAARFADRGRHLETVRSLEELPVEAPVALACLFESRRQLNDFTVRLFDNSDYFVAPVHERTNWALGLGLPMFIVDPPLGSYAPLNRRFLLSAAVARVLIHGRQESAFSGALEKLRQTGELQAMAGAGWERFDTRGFANSAELLQSL